MKALNDLVRALAVLFVPFALSSCAPFNYTAQDAPKALAQVERMTPEPDIALVLGAGGPRGYAHIGVMRVLEESGVDVDLIVGTSVGSLIGVFWGSGMSAAEIDELSMTGGPLTVFDPSPFADRGWIIGQRLQNYVNQSLGETDLAALPRRVVVAATRREDKAPTYFAAGNSGVAVRASSAMPNIISPVGIQGVEYEDGDVSLPLAVEAARAAGARFVIAVNVYPRLESVPNDASDHARAQAERRQKLIDPQVAMADFLIHANTPFQASPRRAFFVEAREIGEREARAQLPALLASLAQHRGEIRP